MKLRVSDLTVEYPQRLLFRGVHLEADDHEIIAVNTGSQDGGTSLLKALAGMLAGVTGSVQVDGREVLGRGDTELIHRIGFVYEAQGLVSLLNVEENVTLPLRYFAQQYHHALTPGDIDRRLTGIWERLQLDRAILNGFPHHLNDVQTRLVNLARAMIVNPMLLLIDELEGGMGVSQQRDTLAAIRDFQREHSIPVVMTAMSKVVLSSADRVYRIDGHKLIQEST